MKTKKIVSIVVLILILMNSMSGIVSAFDINSATIEDLGNCGYHLQFNSNGSWSYVITTMAGYRDNNGNLHYAYCMDVNKPRSRRIRKLYSKCNRNVKESTSIYSNN